MFAWALLLARSTACRCSQLQQAFGRAVRRRREAIGLSQEELADRAKLGAMGEVSGWRGAPSRVDEQIQ